MKQGGQLKRKKIYIPHLNYTIYIKKLIEVPDQLHKHALAYVHKEDNNTCTLYLRDESQKKQYGLMAHETVHIIQYIYESRGIDFILEQEHTGYLMQYILGEIIGLKWQ